MSAPPAPTSERDLEQPKEAGRYAWIADQVFAPLYPVLCQAISQQTGVNHGHCLDLGAGPGHLGLCLARTHQDLTVSLLDPSAAMLALAAQRRHDHDLTNRVFLVQAQAESLPFANDSIHLVTSRGSIFFWHNQVAALEEIHRVLRPGGWAYVGGGFGNRQVLSEIQVKMQVLDPDWEAQRRARTGHQGADHFRTLLDKSPVTTYHLSHDEAGLWITFQKQ